MPTNKASIDALQNMITEVETLLSTTVQLPENRTARCLELLRAVKALAADLSNRAGGVEKGRMRY